MAKLTAAARKRIPSNKFGLADARKYPVEDRGHAIAAKSRASHAAATGRITASQEATIDRKANAELGK